ncbi:MAG: hypothetical protein IKM73_00995 [Acidaminococcaceae bacterium]|nr:hypothetical protein [Lachnospiraceae bacterium]MBR6859884.1 hypothetical protein [Acidaminococcaceae bacterium]
MAEIQMIYRKEKCIHSDPNIRKKHCGNCHISSSWLTECLAFHPSDRGDCACADFKYVYAVETVTECEMSEFKDVTNPWMNCMIVKLKGTIYECTKVILNGELIYQQDDDGFPKERKRGHWSAVPLKKTPHMQDGYTYCSVCGKPEKSWNPNREYCGYCGAYLGEANR